jgi:hypothetical protein
LNDRIIKQVPGGVRLWLVFGQLAPGGKRYVGRFTVDNITVEKNART